MMDMPSLSNHSMDLKMGPCSQRQPHHTPRKTSSAIRKWGFESSLRI
jgi:hypothetical protein